MSSIRHGTTFVASAYHKTSSAFALSPPPAFSHPFPDCGFRDDGILIEDFDNIPTVEDVVQEFEDAQLEEKVRGLRADTEEVSESTTLSDPIESRKDAEIDENSPDDTPASDMI